MYEYEPFVNNKIKKDDRVLVLKPIDGTKPKSTIGLLDPRLFSGKDNLHAVMNPQDCLWGFKYVNGILPEPLRQRFTSFKALYNFGEEYFKRRNLQITEVID